MFVCFCLPEPLLSPVIGWCGPNENFLVCILAETIIISPGTYQTISVPSVLSQISSCAVFLYKLGRDWQYMIVVRIGWSQNIITENWICFCDPGPYLKSATSAQCKKCDRVGSYFSTFLLWARLGYVRLRRPACDRPKFA